MNTVTGPVVLACGAVILFGMAWHPMVAVGQDNVTFAITEVIEDRRSEFVEIRRDIHRHPEVSGREIRTSGLVADYLRALGLTVQTGVGGYGVVATLEGALPGPVVAYRADMDAVRSNDPDLVEFASLNPGIRHICGHDIHTTVGLAVATALASVREELPGTVKFIFQPAEENIQGAAAMIADGVLGSPSPSAIFAVHSSPYRVGTIGVSNGMGLPGYDRITVTISGQADAGEIAQEIARHIENVSTVGPFGSDRPANGSFIWARAVARQLDNGDYRVFATVKASGEEQYALAKSDVLGHLGRAYGLGFDDGVRYVDRELPDMVNDTSLVRWSSSHVRKIVGDQSFTITDRASPYFGEDFAFFQQHIPGVMYWLGVANSAKGYNGIPHSPDFAADDESIFTGARAMSAVLYHYLADFGKAN